MVIHVTETLLPCQYNRLNSPHLDRGGNSTGRTQLSAAHRRFDNALVF